MTVFETNLTIKEFHLDTFGHVNNATYLSLFEQNRWDMISSRGYDLQTIKQTGHGPTILEVAIKFKKELRARQDIVIRSELLDYVKKIGHLKQTILNDQGEVCCEAEFIFGLFDVKQRKLILPTDQWLAAIGIDPQTFSGSWSA